MAGRSARTGASAAAASFANVGGRPLTSSTASLICSAAPTAPSQSATDSRTCPSGHRECAGW